MIQPIRWLSLGLLVAALVSPASGQSEPTAASGRLLRCDFQIFSVDPTDPLGSYQRSAAGKSWANAGEISIGTSAFSVTVSCQSKGKRLSARLHVHPRNKDSEIEDKVHILDLADMQPQSILIHEDNRERTYAVYVVPTVENPTVIKDFSEGALRMHYWQFNGCPVIVDDYLFAGEMGVSGSVTGVQISGVADVEFSMVKLPDFEPLGTLMNGRLTVEKPGKHKLTITGVRNGNVPQELTGGPWRVWVRWRAPSMSTEEATMMVAEQIERLKARAEDSGTTLNPATIARLERMSRATTPIVLGAMGRGWNGDERMKQ